MWLIAGVIPCKIYVGMGYFTTSGRLLHNDQGEIDDKVHVIEKLIQLWVSNPDNPDSAPPSIFLKWAREKKIEIDWLESAQRHGYLLQQEMVATDHAEKPRAECEPETGADPTDLPAELDAANIAYRAVLNGYGDQSDTIRNRLVDFLKTNYKGLTPETVGRIATVANPKKSGGRKKRDKE